MAYANGYSYRKLITIDNTKVAGSSNHTDFPILFSKTDADLAVVGSGGYVQNSSGWDIRFETTGGTKLSHEIEKYVSTTGELVAHVKVPSLLYSVDTELYIYFGQSGLGASDEDIVGTWNTNFRGVWHLKEDPSGSNPIALDSTSNNYDLDKVGTWVSGDQVAGKVGGSLEFDGSTQNLRKLLAAAPLTTDDYVTVSAWIYIQSYPGASNSYVGSISGTYDPDNYKGWAILIGTYNNAANKENLSFSFYSGGWKDSLHSTELALNTWYYVTANYNGTYVTLTVNVGTPQNTAQSGAIADASHFKIGSFSSGVNDLRRFPGIIDEVRVSAEGARSADWLTTEYNNQNSPSTFYLVGTLESFFGTTYNKTGAFALSSSLADQGLISFDTSTSFAFSAGSSDGSSADVNSIVSLIVSNSLGSSAGADLISLAISAIISDLLASSYITNLNNASALFSINLSFSDAASAILGSLSSLGISLETLQGINVDFGSLSQFSISNDLLSATTLLTSPSSSFNFSFGIASLANALVNIILQQSRTFRVMEDDRVLDVEWEDRIFRVIEEDRWSMIL